MVRVRVNPENGLTAIELLIIASIVALVAVFATPMLSNAIFKSDFKDAIDIIESSVERARNTADFYQTAVLMQIETNEEQVAITISIPLMQKDQAMNEVKEEFLLPAGIRVLKEKESIQFNSDGEVEPPAHTLLIYNLAHEKSLQIVIE